MPPPDPAADPGRFAFDGLDRVLHEKARLGLLSSLLAHRDGLAFAQLRDLCQLTDGNLSRHLTTLQEAGLVAVTKGTAGGRPRTTVRLTPAGRRRFLDYLGLLERIVSGALATADPAASRVGLAGG